MNTDVVSTPVNLPLVRRVLRDFLVRPIVQRLHRKRLDFGGRAWRRIFEKDCEKAIKLRVLPQLKINQKKPNPDGGDEIVNVLEVGLETQRWLETLTPRQRLSECSMAVRELLQTVSTNVIDRANVEIDKTTHRSTPPLMGL